MGRLFVALLLCLFIYESFGMGCDVSTTPNPAYPCKRDVVILVDGTPYMHNVQNVRAELDFIEELIGNWTFGDAGVNVAFVNYGFKGLVAYTDFFDNFDDCKAILENFRDLLSSGLLKPTKLAQTIGSIYAMYSAETALYPHRPGIEPRFIAFTSSTDTADIAAAKKYFDQLYKSNYDTILNVAYANLALYDGVNVLKTIDMMNWGYMYFKNISDSIIEGMCYHDQRFTTICAPSTTTPLPLPSSTAKHDGSSTIPGSLKTTTFSQPSTSDGGSGVLTTPGTGGLPGQERKCSCHSKNIWLDIVVVVDNSKSMTQEGLSQVVAHITTLFGDKLTLDPNRTQTARMAIIQVARKSKVIATFEDIRSIDDAMNYLYQIPYQQNEVGVNIQEALQDASNLIRTQGSQRNNTRKVVLFYTSAFTTDGFEDPVPVAHQIIGDGHFIIGVQFIQTDEAGFGTRLSSVTSKNMTFSNQYALNPMNRELFNITIDALCWINCFCINLWTENKNPFTVYPEYAQCLYATDIDAGWTPAHIACTRMANGSYLSFARTSQKLDQLTNLMVNSPTFHGKPNFVIGIRYNSSLNAYQYSDGSQVASADYVPWDSGYPKLANGQCVAAVNTFGFNISYRNIDCYTYATHYPCELPPCDADHYCASLDSRL